MQTRFGSSSLLSTGRSGFSKKEKTTLLTKNRLGGIFIIAFSTRLKRVLITSGKDCYLIINIYWLK